MKNYEPKTKIDYGKKKNYHIFPDEIKEGTDFFVIHPTISPFSNFSRINSFIYSLEYKIVFKNNIKHLLKPVDTSIQDYNVFIPKYQSAGMNRAMKMTDQGSNITDSLIDGLAESPAGNSIIDALDYYLNNYRQGRNWAIFGCSQGSLLAAGAVIQYLSEYQNAGTLKSLKHFYLAGFSPSQKRLDFFKEKIGFEFSQSPTDTNTISAWSCALKDEAENFNNNTAVNDKAVITTNPVTFTTEGETTKSNDLINLRRTEPYLHIKDKIKYTTKKGAGFTLIDANTTDFANKAQIKSCHKYMLPVAHGLEMQKLTIRENMKLRLGLKGL